MPQATTVRTRSGKSTQAKAAGAASASKASRTDRDAAAATPRIDAAEQVIDQLRSGGQNAIGAVRRFIDSIDESLSGPDDGPSRIHDIVDSALVMSDRLVESGSEAVRGIVRSAGRGFGSRAK